jgi:hypothetical protein
MELLYSSGVLSLQDRKQLEFVVRQFKINLHGLFSKRRVLLMNFLVKILPYLPINGSLIHILGRSSGVARSVNVKVNVWDVNASFRVWCKGIN